MRVNGEEMAPWQAVFPLNCDGLARHHIKCWTRILPFESPKPRRRQLRMKALAAFEHLHPVFRFAAVRAVGPQPLRKRQRVDKAVD
jgi:hypothetical protein